MAKFKVGDVCVIINTAFPDMYPIGMEVTIQALRSWDRAYSPCRHGCAVHYVIDRIPANTVVLACDHTLRLKRPPDHPDTESTWDQCPWRPSVKQRPWIHRLLRPAIRIPETQHQVTTS
jgi:hypothetical protein